MEYKVIFGYTLVVVGFVCTFRANALGRYQESLKRDLLVKLLRIELLAVLVYYFGGLALMWWGANIAFGPPFP